MNDLEAPAMMRAPVLNEYVGGAGLVVQDVARPVPEAGEVLIEVAATPINPSDLAFLEGNYSPRPTLPTRAGSLVLAACSGAEDGGSDSTVGVSPGSAMGPGISVEDALTADSGQPLLVSGFLFVEEDGTVTLVSLMAESLPPIPGGDQLVVEGLDLGGYQFSESQGLRWTDDLVQVLGVLNGNTLTVSDTLSG